ncbi:MAG: hydrogenase nickel incorporation protein HypB [Clostridia bacterium]|nr:hydrogenase nickel incorporation protein HypB [Clostridia bacterium]
MDEIRIIEVKQSVFEDNDKDAEMLRAELKEKKTVLINLMSSPGSGKTTLLLGLARRFKERLRLGVMEADIDSAVDAKTMLSAGVDTIQIHTGGMCHLDADMTRQGLLELGFEGYDLVVLENVGNLVCPAEFDTGAHFNMTVLSVPEGDDKPLKYPLMYETCSVLVINKVDVLPYFDFDTERVVANARMRNPEIKVFFVSAKTGQGLDELAEHLLERVNAHLTE